MNARHPLPRSLVRGASALSALLCLSVPSAHALSDAQHRRMLRTSPAYAQADAELGRAWQALRESLDPNSPEWKRLLAEQRAWLRSGRDREARALRGGGSEADGYAAAVRERAASLRERVEEAGAPASGAAGSASSSAAPAGSWRAAYLEAARDFVREHRLPDGEDLNESAFADRDFAENRLAIRDVDGDGRPELLVRFEAAPMAGKQEYVYGFDEGSGRIVEKLSGFPGIEYFDNGCAKEPIAHNQGPAGDFWPFTLHKLNAGTGKYAFVGFVDAWNEEAYAMVHADDGKRFPKQVDAVGDGYVYFIHTVPDTYTDAAPVDTPVFRAWLDRCVGGGSPVKPDWVPANTRGLEALRRQE